MGKISKNRLIASYNEVIQSEDYRQTLANNTLFGNEVFTILLRKVLKLKYRKYKWIERLDYDFIIEWDDEKKIFWGKPILLSEEIYNSCENLDELSVGIIYRPLTKDDYKEVAFNLSSWPEQIEGIAEDATYGEYPDLIIPNTIKALKPKCLQRVTCGRLFLPVHLFSQLTLSCLSFKNEADVTLENIDGYRIENKITRQMLSNPKTQQQRHNNAKYQDIKNKGEDVVIYQGILDACEDIVLYKDKITIFRNGKEMAFIPGFRWKKFYETRDDLIMSLLMAKYNILTISNIEAAMLDIYRMTK